MKKLIMISSIYLSSLVLLISCSGSKALWSRDNFSYSEVESKKNSEVENITPRCTKDLITAIGYTEEQYTRLVMECNILKIQSLDASVRKIKGQRRIEIVYLNVKCDEISRMISQYNTKCKNDLTITKF